MYLTRAVLGVAGVPLLSGCMVMGGWGHTAGLTRPDVTGHTVTGQRVVSSPEAEASSDGLTITLSISAPADGAEATIRARLRSDIADREPAGGEIWLSIRTPRGTVDRLRMAEPQSVGDWTYRAEYAFATSGAYLVTADARVGAGLDARAVSLTTAVEVGGGRREDGPQWVTRLGALGALGMLALMAVMVSVGPH